jgi:hypothetical protein
VLGDAGKDSLSHSRAFIIHHVYAQYIPGMQCEVADLMGELGLPVAIQIDQKVS